MSEAHQTRDEDRAPPLPESWAGEPRLIAFFIPAPKALAFPHGSTFSLERDEQVPWLSGVPLSALSALSPRYRDPDHDDRNFVSFHIWRFPEQITVDVRQIEHAIHAFQAMVGSSAVEDEAQRMTTTLNVPDIDSQATVFEAVTPLIPSMVNGQIDRQKTVSDAFDRCLESMTELYRAYVIVTQAWHVRTLTRRTVAPFIPWSTRDPWEMTYGEPGMFAVNDGETTAMQPTGSLDGPVVEQIMWTISRRRQGGERGDPSATAAEHARRAQRAYHIEADYSVCIVWAFAWIEVLLDGLLMMSAWDERRSVKEVARWVNMPFVKRVLTHLRPRFGGDWHAQTTDNPFDSWLQKVAQLRHKIIHDSYQASEKEARTALDACGRMEDFVKERLVQNRHKYPRTALIILGGPGLERRGGLDESVLDIAEQSAHEDSWLESYAEYVSEVRARTRFAQF